MITAVTTVDSNLITAVTTVDSYLITAVTTVDSYLITAVPTATTTTNLNTGIHLPLAVQTVSTHFPFA